MKEAADFGLCHGSRAPASFALAGFSFGGYVAQEIARQAPHRIERLALLDTGIRADTPQRSAMRRSMSASVQLPGAFLGIADRLLPTFIDESRLSDYELVGRLKAMTRRLGREVLLRQNAMVRSDGEAALRPLSCDILVVCGDRDALTPLSDHEELVAMLPRARLCVIEGSGHMTPMERPMALTKALRPWLGASPIPSCGTVRDVAG